MFFSLSCRFSQCSRRGGYDSILLIVLLPRVLILELLVDEALPRIPLDLFVFHLFDLTLADLSGLLGSKLWVTENVLAIKHLALLTSGV